MVDHMSNNQITINNLSKVYDNGFKALSDVNLEVKQGEILAMLGPNGAGKTTLISIICGVVKPSSGTVTIDNFDIIENYQDKQFIDIRNTIYNFFIYGIDISESLWMVINYFIKKKKLDKENIDFILSRLYVFFKYYNNNYRPIYHLESIIYYLIKIIHEL